MGILIPPSPEDQPEIQSTKSSVEDTVKPQTESSTRVKESTHAQILFPLPIDPTTQFEPEKHRSTRRELDETKEDGPDTTSSEISKRRVFHKIKSEKPKEELKSTTSADAGKEKVRHSGRTWRPSQRYSAKIGRPLGDGRVGVSPTHPLGGETR